MPRNDLYCTMLIKGRMNPFIAKVVFDTSQEMVRHGLRAQKLAGDYEGMITTDGAIGHIGHIYGQIFRARVVSQINETDVELDYIIRATDLNALRGDLQFSMD